MIIIVISESSKLAQKEYGEGDPRGSEQEIKISSDL